MTASCKLGRIGSGGGAGAHVQPFGRGSCRPFARRLPIIQTRRHNSATPRAAGLQEVADALGDEVYVDVNGWRLYLRDMKHDGAKTMNQVLAESVVSGQKLEDALKQISVQLGGGKKEVSLFDIIPNTQVNNAKNALMDLER